MINRLALASVASFAAIMFLASMATLMRAYLVVKLCFLALFLFAFIANIALKRTEVIVHRRLVLFYLWISVAGVVWAVVGLLHPANYVQAVLDALKLYVVWSAAFIVLYTLLRTAPSLRPMHIAMVTAGILIPLINLVALYDQVVGLGLIPDGMREQLALEIGLGDGYVRFSTANIISMFLVAPYLLSLQFRADAASSNSFLTKLALFLSLTFVVLSGRRALWIVVALTPCTILLLAGLTRSYGLMKANGRRFLLACSAAGMVALGTFLLIPESGPESGPIGSLKEAFSAEDARSLQTPYLINGFMKSPVFGSGFGGYAGYKRNELRPWTYELTYHMLLFNTGLLGSVFLLTLYGCYFFLVIGLLRRFKQASAIPFSLLVAFCSLLVGSYSNPYLGGFDSLFFAGLLPYLSTFQHGFDRS